MSFTPLALEPLETRRLLSIVWANRGARDGFEAAYGDDAPVARALVDAAVADWNAAVTTPRSFKVTIRAADIEPRQRNSTTLGITIGRTIKLDTDAAGGLWYFDPNLADDSEFTDVPSDHTARGDEALGSDFFSVTLHELGHVLGFKDKVEPFIRQLTRRDVKDVFHTSRDDLMNAIVADGSRQLITTYDILHTKWGRAESEPIAPRRFSIMSVT